MEKTELINPADINHNDTLIIDGQAYTTGSEDIRFDSFTGQFIIMGINIRHFKTYPLVERMLFKKWHKSEMIGWVPQI
jgi:hypothetical protein